MSTSKSSRLTKTGPSEETRQSPEYKQKLLKAREKSAALKARRAVTFKHTISELGVSHSEITRLFYLLPAGVSPTNSQKSKLAEKLRDNEGARQPNMADLLAAQMLLLLKENGIDVTKLDFDENGKLRNCLEEKA